MVKDEDHLQATINKTIPSVIKFDIPDAVRDFLFFMNLPKEIRHMIWESFLMTPGIQFVKLQSVEPNSDWMSLFHPPLAVTSEGDSELNQTLSHDFEPRLASQTCLVPAATCLKSDFSHYKALHRDIKTLESTCHESREVAKFLCNRGGALKSADGKIVSLGKSPDAIFLDYLPQTLYKTNCTLASVPLCSGLEHLRRIAIKFCHHWRERTLPCGDSDDTFESDAGCYPTHLYQFLARHLPNLQEVFFVDYYIVPKIEDAITPEMTRVLVLSGHLIGSPCRFQAGNRVFHEVNEDEWIVNKKILRMTDWLRSSYVRYATSSKLCKHKDPKTVRFAILGCQWQIAAPVQRYNLKRKHHQKSDFKPRQMRRVMGPNCRKGPEADFAFNVPKMQSLPELNFHLGNNGICAAG